MTTTPKNTPKKLFTIQQAADFLGVNPGTIRRWALNKSLRGMKVGSRGDWRFVGKELAKLISRPNVQHEQKQRFKIKKILIENADAIQKSATANHAKLIGSSVVPRAHFAKYKTAHIKIVKSIANHLSDFNAGTIFFKKFGEELAKGALRDGLTIEEAMDGTIFLKQAIWKKLADAGILREISVQDLYTYNQMVGNYCDMLASKIAFTYHHYFVEQISGSDERFRTLIEKSMDAIALVTPKGKVIYASPATEWLMGYTPEEFKKLTNPFALVPPDDRKFVTKIFEKLLKKQGRTEHVVYRVLHKNGKHIWIESDMTNLTKDPNIKAIVINYRDVTQRKLLETQKNDFISIATHELKTPVTSIKAYAQLLQAKFQKEGNTKSVDMLSKMDAQLNKLAGLIGDLLDISRVDGGKLQFHEGSFDFNELVSEIIQEMKLTSAKHPISEKLDDTKIVDGDRDRIGQIITNLLSNAIKYSPHNEKIIVSSSWRKNEITLRVQDFGIGIAEHQHGKVFERFFRVGDAEDTYAGLGLGLFISSEIIKRHGGKIWVESTGVKGSTFCFTLPIRRSTKIPKDTNTLVEEGKAQPDKKKILVVDDDPAILEVIALILEDEGYDVKTTVNGYTEETVQDYAPDLILLDIWMSGVDGRKICKSLKANAATKDIPIVMISANKDTEKISKESGADGFLNKPFDIKDLLGKVAVFTNKRNV